MWKYYQYKLSTLHGKKTKKNNQHSVRHLYNVSVSTDLHTTLHVNKVFIIEWIRRIILLIAVTGPPFFSMFALYELCVGLCIHRLKKINFKRRVMKFYFKPFLLKKNICYFKRWCSECLYNVWVECYFFSSLRENKHLFESGLIVNMTWLCTFYFWSNISCQNNFQDQKFTSSVIYKKIYWVRT